MSRRPSPAVDRGAGLILAIGFVTMIGSITAGLMSLVISGLGNQIALTELRDRQYAAEAGVEWSIVQLRQWDRTTACSPANDGFTVTSMNSITVRVDTEAACTTVRGADGTAVAQRNTLFTACVDTGGPCAPDDVLVRAHINFEESAAGGVTRTFVQSWSLGG